MGVHETKGRSREDPGKIHRSKGFGVQGCWRKYGKEGVGVKNKVMRIRARRTRGKAGGEGETRTMECGGVLGNLVRSDEERFCYA